MKEHYNAAVWLLDRHVDEDRGGRIAVDCGDEQLTYADVQRQVFRAQRALERMEVRREERVVLVVDDEPGFIAWFLGCLRSAIVPVPVSTMLTGSDLATIVDDAGATAVVLSSAYAPHLVGIAQHCPQLRTAVLLSDAPADPGVDIHRWVDLVDDSEVPVAQTVRDSPAFWLYSSGTTGAPKGVMHCHGNLEATATTFARSNLSITPADRCFSVAKLFFAYGLGNSLTFPFSVGATAVLDPARPSPAGVAALLVEKQPSLFFASPGFLAAMLDAEIPATATASVRLGCTAGEALPADLHRRFTERHGFPVLDGIGSTEALHIFLSNRVGEERPGTSGRPVEGYEVKLLSDGGSEVTAPDVPGQLHVRGDSIASGYWCRSAATRANFRGDWLRTGDVYQRTEDGYYRFLGRNNDMIKVGGIWVSPAEVESCLVAQPDVLEAAVVGASTDDGLETAVAFVVPRSGHTIHPADLEAHCRTRMAAFKRPRRIVIVDALPKTATGKVQRFALREELAAERR